MRSLALAILVGLVPVGESAARSYGSSRASAGNTYTPFSDFGSDIPGYQNPTTAKRQAAPAAPGLAGAVAPGAGVASPAGPPLPGGADPAEAAEAAAERSPQDEFGNPIDVEREDAQENFQTVVESFVAKNGVDGCWPFREKNRALCLAFFSADARRLKRVKQGVYSGLVVLRDVKKRLNRVMIFTVDFSGDDWTVASIQPVGANAKPIVFGKKDVDNKPVVEIKPAADAKGR